MQLFGVFLILKKELLIGVILCGMYFKVFLKHLFKILNSYFPLQVADEKANPIISWLLKVGAQHHGSAGFHLVGSIVNIQI